MNNDDILSLPRLVSSIKREYKLIVICIASFLGLAILYSIFAIAKYTASTSIMIDPEQSATVAELSSKAKTTFEDAAITSQIELIKSRRVAEKAMNYMANDGQIEIIESQQPIDENELMDMMKGLEVFREGKSYVLTIAYTSKNPNEAANRANAFAQAYIYDQINSFSEDSLKTTQWLTQKIAALREQSIAANLEIQKFRQQNNIVESGGRSVNDQQLSSINERLSAAKANVARTRVKYLHSKDIVAKNNITAAVAEAFDNDVINNVRSQYLDDQKKYLELKRTLGSDHQAVKSLGSRLSESRNVIFSEMRRMAESYKSDYEIAFAEQQSLEKSLNDLVGVKLSNDGQSFELQALEKEAESYANLHEEYLQKYEMLQQQQSFPVTGSRIISKAVPPLDKSHPKSVVLIGLGLILGAGLGVLAALIKDNFDSSFKRAGQIENAVGLHFLGFSPAFKGKNIGIPKASEFLDSEFSQSVDVPLSLQAETCRNIKINANKKITKACKVIGVTSDNPHQGKSVMAANLALYIAQSGSKCLLIDADLRNPILSEENFVKVDNGLGAVLSKSVSLQNAIIQDPKTNLFILPSESKQSLTSGLVGSENMKDLIDKTKDGFEYIIIDLPALAATADASFSSVFVDAFLLVLEWGKAKPNNLDFNLKLNEISKDKILGVVLAQADMKEMAKNYGHVVYSQYIKA